MKEPLDWGCDKCIRALHDAICISDTTDQVAKRLDKLFFSTCRTSNEVTKSMIISGLRRNNVFDAFRRLFPQEVSLLSKFEGNQKPRKRTRAVQARAPRAMKKSPAPQTLGRSKRRENNAPPLPRYTPLSCPGDLAPLRGENGKTAKVLDLTSSVCRFPIGDPSHKDFAFCGRTVSVGRPYCADHARIANPPVTKR